MVDADRKVIIVGGVVFALIVMSLMLVSNFTGYAVHELGNKSVGKDGESPKDKLKESYDVVVPEEQVVPEEEVAPEEVPEEEAVEIENVSATEEVTENVSAEEVIEVAGNETENVSVLDLGLNLSESAEQEGLENMTNITGLNETENVSEVEGNVSDVSELESIVSNIIQYRAVINRPVKWLSKVKVTKEGKMVVKLPKKARDISVLTGGEISAAESEVGKFNKIVNKSDRKGLAKGKAITGDVVFDISQSEGALTKLWNWITRFGVTGQVISEEDIANNIARDDGETELDLSGAGINESEVGIEYYTDAPTAEEEKTVDGKRITVSADDELGYENVLAYTELNPEVEEDKIEFYHVVNGTRVPVNFTAYDLNDNGLIDYIEWDVDKL